MSEREEGRDRVSETDTSPGTYRHQVIVDDGVRDMVANRTPTAAHGARRAR